MPERGETAINVSEPNLFGVFGFFFFLLYTERPVGTEHHKTGSVNHFP